jgi:hypothetical protein
MKNRAKIIRKRGEHGSTMVEAIFALLLLLLIFCGFLQIFKMSAVKMLCDYSTYCTARGKALGYRNYIVQRAARVPLMPVSGEAIVESGTSAFASSSYQRASLDRFGTPGYSSIYQQARSYMMYGAMVVDFAYWDSENEHNSTGTAHEFGSNFAGNSIDGLERNLIVTHSGFTNYPSGFEFLDPQKQQRMTLSVVHADKVVATDDEFTYDVNIPTNDADQNRKNTTMTMQNYSRYIIEQNYRQ